MDALFIADASGAADRATRAGRNSPRSSTGCGQLGPARRGGLGDPRRPQGLHLRPVPVLGRARPGDPDGRPHRPPGQHRQVDRRAGPALRPDHGPRLERQGRRVHPALRHRRARLLAAAHAARGLHRPAGPDVAVHAAGDRPRTGLRQPGLPVQPGRLAGRAARRRGHLLAVHLPVRRRARPVRAARRGRADVREDADLRQPPRPVLRGDRTPPASSSATSRRRSPTCR